MLSEGMLVKINPRSDRTRQKLVNGKIVEVLTSAEEHPHGILVKLDNGEVGRVKEVIEEEGVANQPKPEVVHIVDEKSAKELIESGENHFVEFKTSALWSQGLDKQEIIKRKIEQYGENTSKVIIAKSLAGFLNADGGHFFIGVKEIKDTDDIEIVGINGELKKLKDKTIDGYRRMLLDTIIGKYLPPFVFNRINDYLRINFHEFGPSIVCHVEVMKSDKRVFITVHGQDIFMVRIDASTRQIVGNDLVQYCLDRFK